MRLSEIDKKFISQLQIWFGIMLDLDRLPIYYDELKSTEFQKFHFQVLKTGRFLSRVLLVDIVPLIVEKVRDKRKIFVQIFWIVLQVINMCVCILIANMRNIFWFDNGILAVCFLLVFLLLSFPLSNFVYQLPYFNYKLPKSLSVVDTTKNELIIEIYTDHQELMKKFVVKKRGLLATDNDSFSDYLEIHKWFLKTYSVYFTEKNYSILQKKISTNEFK